MFAVLRHSGIQILSFILLNIIRRDNFRSDPITPSLKISGIQLLGSLLFPTFNDFKTFSNSFISIGGLLFFLALSNLSLNVSFFVFKMVFTSSTTGLFLILWKKCLSITFFFSFEFVIILPSIFLTPVGTELTFLG